jgi:tRNA nucleotidyltransferase (CCA-adding enzyme)
MTEMLPGPSRLDPPEPVQEIARRLERAGFEAWCVGGAVRDALLGHPHLDWDLATSATPGEVRRLFRRTVPVGVEFGTVGVLDREGTMHEVTTFRRDVQTDGRHAVVEFGASPDDDLARRDFTINAIAFSPTTGRIHDPFEGRDDLRRGVVRAVGAPDERMREDRLRALRALRFAARFDFTIEPRTWQAIVASAPHLGRLSRERVKQELEKTMEQVERPGRAIALWRDSGSLASLIPPLRTISDLALAALDQLPRPDSAAYPQRKINRLTALFAELEPQVARQVMRDLRFSNRDVDWITDTIARWHALQNDLREALRDDRPPTDLQIRRWVAVIGRTRVSALLRLAAAWFAAERLAGRPAPTAARVASLYRRALRIAFRDPVEISDLAVDGDDLIAAGIPTGPLIGRILRLLLDEVLEDPSRNTREWLLERAVQLYRELSQ